MQSACQSEVLACKFFSGATKIVQSPRSKVCRVGAPHPRGYTPAPTGRRSVAAGGAQPAAKRAERNPWKRSVIETPAPTGRRKQSACDADRCYFVSSGTPFAPPGRKENKEHRFSSVPLSTGSATGRSAAAPLHPRLHPVAPLGLKRGARRVGASHPRGCRAVNWKSRATSKIRRGGACLARPPPRLWRTSRPCTLRPYRPVEDPPWRGGAGLRSSHAAKARGKRGRPPSSCVFVSSAPDGATETPFNRPRGAHTIEDERNRRGSRSHPRACAPWLLTAAPVGLMKEGRNGGAIRFPRPCGH
jgi:hypothetical protein